MREKLKVRQMAGITNLLYPQGTNVSTSESRLRFEREIGDKYCLFLDYDKLKNDKEAIKEAKMLLSNKPTMSDLWILKTKEHHYWILSFGIYSRQQVLDMMFLSNCDPEYFKFFKIFGQNTLRLSLKANDNSELTLVKIIKNDAFMHVSAKHLSLFENIFKKFGSYPIPLLKECGLRCVYYLWPNLNSIKNKRLYNKLRKKRL